MSKVKITLEMPQEAMNKLFELIRANDPKWLELKKEFNIEAPTPPESKRKSIFGQFHNYRAACKYRDRYYPDSDVVKHNDYGWTIELGPEYDDDEY